MLDPSPPMDTFNAARTEKQPGNQVSMTLLWCCSQIPQYEDVTTLYMPTDDFKFQPLEIDGNRWF